MYYHSGLTPVGVLTGTSVNSLTFSCCAKLIEPMPKYAVAGIRVRYDEAYLPVSGFICSSGSKVPYTAQGISLSIGRHVISVEGIPQWGYAEHYLATAFTDLIPLSKGWLVKATRRGRDYSYYGVEAVSFITSKAVLIVKGASSHRFKQIYKVVSAFRNDYERYYKLRGDISGKIKKPVVLIGNLCLKTKDHYLTKGLKATGSRFVAKMSGAVGRTMKIKLKATGQLGGNRARAKFALKGLIPKMAFIASVPKRFQHFVTNKRWFR